ncbi:MAG TPA: dodecin family protein [Egibacteraceae bacterium]
MTVLNSIELEGVSSESWDRAAEEALKEASRTLRNIRRLDILGTSATVRDGEVVEYRTQVRLVFAVEPSRGRSAEGAERSASEDRADSEDGSAA